MSTILVLVLRVFTLMVLAASVVFIATNNFTISDGSDQTKFTDIIAFRYIFAVGIVGFVYTLIQLPFVIYHVVTDKRLISNGCAPEFDFYGDKVMSLLVATGVGVGFGVSLELKRYVNPFFDSIEFLGATGPLEEERSKSMKFFNRSLISIGLLAAGFVSTILLSIISSINRTPPQPSATKRFFF